MSDITCVVFGKMLRFSDFPRVKSLFLQKKLNIDLHGDTDRIVKKGLVKETTKTDDLIELVVDESLIFYD
jgi:hypothetical protein